MKINTVTVVGANGTMGLNGSAIFAAFGNAKVYMVSRDLQKSRNAVDKAIKSVRAEVIRENLIPCDYSNLEECVSKSDLIFESVSENLTIKKDITEKIGRFARKDAIIATGTSGLSVNEISKVLPDKLRLRYFGMHFFNPPYSMPLLELVKNNESDHFLTEEIKTYLQTKLLRTVVIVEDKPAFLANRIGFQFINLALQYAEKYKNQGGIDYIDSIIGPFTGRAMSPCATADFVGLDVHKAIVDNLYKNTNDYLHETFKLPGYVEELVAEGKLGKKSGCGLFKSVVDENGIIHNLTYDIVSGHYVSRKSYSFPFSNYMINALSNGDYADAFDYLNNDSSVEATICKEFLKDYVEYSKYVVNEVCNDKSYADDAMATGFNWCPPLALANVVFGENNKTKYDYRSFFRAGR